MAAYRLACTEMAPSALLDLAVSALEELRRDGLLSDAQAAAHGRYFALSFSAKPIGPPTAADLEFEGAMFVCRCNVSHDEADLARLREEAERTAAQARLLADRGL